MGNRECEFNLLDEPWIKVMKRDGTIDEVSLITVFEQAHLYTDLAGELATQNVAVLRLLLAVLHTVILSILVDTFISKISLPMQPVPEIGSISVA